MRYLTPRYLAGIRRTRRAVRYLGATFSLESRGKPGTSVWNEVAPRYLALERSDERGAQRADSPDAAARRRSLLVRKQSGQQQWLQRPSHRCRTIDSAAKGPVRHHRQEHGDAAAHVTQTTQRQAESAMSSVAIPMILHGVARAPHLTGDCSTSENPPLQRSHERQRNGLMLPARRHCKLAPFHRQPRRRLGGQPMYVENGRGV